MPQILKNQSLEVSIDLPGELYTASRFDWSSIVSSIILDGRYQFISSEKGLPETFSYRGRGLASEIGIHGSLGYELCQPGQEFIKAGVGRVKREDTKDYFFYNCYRDLRPYPWATSQGVNAKGEPWICFAHGADPTDIHPLEYSRTWFLDGNSLASRISLKNCGTQAIDTTEYCHNFLRLHQAGSDPAIELSWSFAIPGAPLNFSDPDGAIHPIGPMPAPATWHPFKSAIATEFYFGPLFKEEQHNPWWKMTDTVHGLSIQESLEGPCCEAAVWGRYAVLSPELFYPIKLAAGQSTTWTRRWTFSKQ